MNEKDKFVEENFFNDKVDMKEEYYNKEVENSDSEAYNEVFNKKEQTDDCDISVKTYDPELSEKDEEKQINIILEKAKKIKDDKKTDTAVIIKFSKLNHAKLKLISVNKNTSVQQIVNECVMKWIKEIEFNEPEMLL